MDLLLKALLLLSVGVHLFSEGCLGDTLLEEVVVGEEDFKLLLRLDLGTVLSVQLVNMVSAVFEVELFKTDAAEADGESLIGLGVQLHRLDVSATHLAHQTYESFHHIGWGLRVLSVQIGKDLLEVVHSDLLLEQLYLGLFGLNLRLNLIDLGGACLNLLLKLLVCLLQLNKLGLVGTAVLACLFGLGLLLINRGLDLVMNSIDLLPLSPCDIFLFNIER